LYQREDGQLAISLILWLLELAKPFAGAQSEFIVFYLFCQHLPGKTLKPLLPVIRCSWRIFLFS
jgi:hypothetical protein